MRLNTPDGESATRWLGQALGLSARETPFPWQSKLLSDLLAGKHWPAIDVPTGLGKTSVIAIWLIARALGATVPRRLIYVVDRRAVVDQATEVALSLREFVQRAPDFKRLLGLDEKPLPVSTLRGQHVDNREWLENPAAPAIIVGTVDMVGSRFLFQGYGVSRKMRPYHAGMLGIDTLLIVDEAHLITAFADLVKEIGIRIDLFGPREELESVVPSLRFMSLSATGRDRSTKALGLTEEDLEHPVISRRLAASKRLTVRHVRKNEELVCALADAAWELTAQGKRPLRCIIFCDKRQDAVRVKEELERLSRGDRETGADGVEVQTELFVGSRRVLERVEAAERLEQLGFIAGKPKSHTQATFLFATSAAEVGVDLDADCMAGDLVSWERLIQRLGRVNRRGDVPGGADVTIAVEGGPEADKRTQEALNRRPEERDDKEQKAVLKYEQSVARLATLLRPLDLLRQENGVADISLAALRELNKRAENNPELRQILEAATTPAPLRPPISRAVVEAWSMTSLESHPGRPEIEPWLRGWIEGDPPQTRVIWRGYLPVRSVEGGQIVAPREVESFFEAAPPHTSEVLETETLRVVDWLNARAKAILNVSKTVSTLSKGLNAKDISSIILTNDLKFKKALSLEELKTDKDSRKELQSELQNAIIVVNARVAGLSHGLLDNAVSDPPPTADAGSWAAEVGFRVRVANPDQPVPRNRQWRERLRIPLDVNREGEPNSWLIVEKERLCSANEEDRSTARCQPLEEHREWTEQCASALATKINLPEEYREMLRVAAFLHDEGKRSSRWQRAFNAPDGEIYAKTEGPINYALLADYRHELGSILSSGAQNRLQRLSPHLRDLALHLIAAHHGFARPVIGTGGCDESPPSALERVARDIALRYAELQQHWGPWALAWWESLLRAADQQASRNNEDRERHDRFVARSGLA